MSIQVNLNAFASANLTAVTTGATSTYVTYATANISGPGTIGVGSQILGFSGNAVGAVVTAVNATVAGLANVTVSVLGNVVAQTYSNVTNSVYASRITNRYVYDFGSNGSLSSNITGGYNPNKYRYHLAAPDSTYVMVAYA
jgi:hypothetical protein